MVDQAISPAVPIVEKVRDVGICIGVLEERPSFIKKQLNESKDHLFFVLLKGKKLDLYALIK